MDRTYEEVKREVLQGLLNGVIFEMALRNDITMFVDKEKTEIIDYKNTAEYIIDAMNQAEDEDFEKFKNKLIELFYDML